MVVWFSPRHGRGAPHPRQLVQDGVDVFLRGNPLADRDREVAVGTAADAEGDVDVKVLHGGKVSFQVGSFNPGPAARG